MKKFLCVLFAILMICTVSVSVYANSDNTEPPEYSVRTLVFDDANRLTDEQEHTLHVKLADLSAKHKMDISVAIVNSFAGNSIGDFADEFYRERGLGYGENRDGSLFILSLEFRDWAIFKRGKAEEYFTDDNIDVLIDSISSKLSNNLFYDAFDGYIDKCDEIIASHGKFPSLGLIWFPISLIIGIVVALISVSSMKSALKSVRSQAGAYNYIKSESMNLTEQKDIFLYKTLTKTKKPEPSSSGRSSSSMSHGSSRSGKF